MTIYPPRETGPHVPMIDDWYAYPEVSDTARETKVSDAEYLFGRRSLLRGIVRSCDRYGAYITKEARAIARQSDRELADQAKPDHVETWADFHADFEEFVSYHMNLSDADSDKRR